MMGRKRRIRALLCRVAAGFCAIALHGPAVAAPAPTAIVSPADVDAAIEKGKTFIYSQMKGSSWEDVPSRDPSASVSKTNGGQWGGQTALCVYALLAAGESPQEPRLLKAIEFLRTADIVGTYALGLRSQVWLNIPKNDQIRAAIDKDAKLLLLARRTKGPEAGLYHYTPGPPKATDIDHSCSQYGVLGLWACSDATEIPDSFWSESDAVWRKDQGEDGSWAYNSRPGSLSPTGGVVKGTPAMTAAGLATLFITQDFLTRGRGLTCTGNVIDKNVAAGLQWYSDYFKKNGTNGLFYYSLYGLERIGVASGYKYFGDTDWFQAGAAYTTKSQNPDGSFPGNKEQCTSLQGTALALLFLSRGRAPVMMNKLNYDFAGTPANTPGDWNQRPRDLANVVRWVGKETENTLNWQITSLNASPEDWHDSPILYIAGDQTLNFTPEQKQKFKTFVEEGGLIVGNADCGKRDFSDSFRKIGSELFPNYEFKQLPAKSTILHDEQFNAAKWRHPVPIFGIDNGARQLMLLIPDADPSKAWQMQQSAGKEELFQLAANIFLYSVDKDGLTAKGDTYVVVPDPKIKPLKSLTIQRIQYPGNSDPEPGGWHRMSAVLHNADHVDLTTNLITADKLSGNSMAFLTGTDAFKFTDAQVAGIKAFVAGGGTLVVDSAGGNADFADAAERLLKLVFGGDADQLKIPLPDTHPLYSTGGPLGEVTYRTYARSILGNLRGPQLRGITQNGRLVCIFSREDLSVGIVGEAVDGIIGYSPATATNLMRKIILYATNTNPIATTAIPSAAPIALKKPATKPAT